MRFSICPTFNPGPKFGGAEFSARFTSTGGVFVHSSLGFSSAIEAGFIEAIESGIAEYAANPPDDLGPMPSDQITIEKIYVHETSDPGAFRIVGALASRELHKSSPTPRRK
ncbi:MAG: hypothetical protein V4710_13790 [Verrucomicrobiota bacterium]